MLTLERLKEVLNYDPKTGKLIWIKKLSNRTEVGKEAGCRVKGDHLRLSIDNVLYMVHVIIFFYMTGNWPKNEIDHINADGLDNRWENLREATHQENSWNTKKRASNKSGHKGVYWASREQCWISEIVVSGKKYTSYHRTVDEAVKTRKNKIMILHGDFAREG